jgi:glycosyltransferase involved in cell wall biosynthesis
MAGPPQTQGRPATTVPNQSVSAAIPGLMPRPKKVLHVLNGAGGGAALSTLALIEAFQKLGIEACAVCHDAGSPSERQRLHDATRGAVLFTPLYWWNRKIRAALWKRPLIELRQLLRTGWVRRSTEQVARFAQVKQVDLIHTNTMLTPEGGLAARRLGLSHVWHLRELLGPGHPFRLSMDGSKLHKYLEQHASLVVANSHISAATAGDAISPEMLRIVPNGIDLRAFKPRGSTPTVGRRRIVAMVGAVTSRTKHHSLFIEAAAQVVDIPNVEFRIYGHDPLVDGTRRNDPYSAHIHALAARFFGSSDRFRFCGHVADPARIMSEIDILVHPADNESFGRVAVEAMAAGLPVIGTRGGGIAEIVVDGVTGLLAAPNDPDDLAIKLQSLIDAPDLCAQFGAAGRARAEAHYSIEACAKGVLQAYEAAMQRPVGSPRNGVSRQ